MRGEDVDGRAVDVDRQVGVRLRREGEALEHLVGVPARAIGVGREEGARHVLPQEVLERADLVGLDRVLRVDDETVLTRERAETPGVARVGGTAVFIEVEAAGNAGVHRSRPGVGVGDGGGAVVGDFEVVRAEQVNGSAFGVVVEFVDEEDVRIHPLNGFRDVRSLCVVRGGEVCEELATRIAVEAGIEGGDREHTGGWRLRGGGEDGAGCHDADNQGKAGGSCDRAGFHQ